MTRAESELDVRCWCLHGPGVVLAALKQFGVLAKPDTKRVLVVGNMARNTEDDFCFLGAELRAGQLANVCRSRATC